MTKEELEYCSKLTAKDINIPEEFNFLKDVELKKNVKGKTTEGVMTNASTSIGKKYASGEFILLILKENKDFIFINSYLKENVANCNYAPLADLSAEEIWTKIGEGYVPFCITDNFKNIAALYEDKEGDLHIIR